MKCELSAICDYRKSKVDVSKLNLTTYVSTENMCPNKGGITEAAGLPNCRMTQGFHEGDILVSNIRPYFKKIWRAKYSGGCSNDVLVFVAKNNTDPTFLYYLLSEDSFFSYATATSKGTKMPRGDRVAIMRYPVPSYDISVQKRIAAILSSLDDKIELNNKINANLEQQGAEFVRQYRSVTDVGVPLSDIMSFDNGFPFQGGTYLSSGRYRVITIKNVQDGYIDSKGAAFIDKVPLKMKPNCVLHVGDVLLSLTGNVGRVGIVCESGLLLNQRVAKIVPKKQELLPFLYFFYRQSDIKILLESIAKGTAQLNLSPLETLNLTVPYKEESAILLSRLLSRLFQKVVANTQENLTLSTLRDALLSRLMSGQIEL